MERLQRVMAARGSGSRRSAEALIVAGRVQVDGKVVTELGTRVDPVKAEIRVDGKVLRPQRPRVLMLNKPSGFITTVSDERERRTVMELVNVSERVYPVGRLDRDTEGLLLFTNDGDIANRVMHPRYGLAKEYQVLTRVRPTDATLQRVRAGFVIDGQKVVPAEFRILRQTREGLVLKIVVHQGLYHVVRRLMQSAGIPVDGLRRVRIGPLSIEGIAVGAWRDLTPGELSQLLQALHLDEESDGEVGAYPSWRQSRVRSRLRPSLARHQSHDDAETPARTPPMRPAARARTPQRQSDGQSDDRGRQRQDQTEDTGRRQRGNHDRDTPRRSAADLERMGQRRGRTRKPTQPGRDAPGEQRPHGGERQEGGHGRTRGKFGGSKGRPSQPSKPGKPGKPTGPPPRDRDRRGRGGGQDDGRTRTRRPPEGDAV